MKTHIYIILSILFSTVSIAQTFQDNMSKERIGDFPSQWDLVQGVATVEQHNGYKFINFNSGSIIKPIVNKQTNNYLSKDFTVEFDVFFGLTSSIYGQRIELRFWDGEYGYNQGDITYKPIIIKRNGLETSWKHPQSGSAKNYLKELHTLQPVWRHVKIECKTGKLKIHLDNHLILNFPKFKMQPTMVSIAGKINDSRHEAKVGFTNFVITNVIDEETQSLDDDTCGAYPTEAQLRVLSNPNSLFNRRLKFLQNYSVQDLIGVPAVQQINGEFLFPQQVRFSTTATENYTIIPIAVHILRQSNHTGGLSLNDLYASVNRANELFDRYGVYLHVDNIQFIDDDNLFNTEFDKGLDMDKNDINDYIETIGIINRNIIKKLNIYFVPKAVTSWANFPSQSNLKQHIIMVDRHTKNESTLTHEIGHWFNLLHTHDTNNGVESINGSNCSTTGDLCCDTPADPKLNDEKVDAINCTYIGTDTDENNNSYSSDPTNLMSYSRKRCRDNFSDEQLKRMLNAYLGIEEDRGYKLEVNSGIGQNIQTASLSPGWRAAQHFEIGNKTFMACFNDSTSEMAIHELRKNGKLGSQIDYKDYNGSLHFIGVFNKGINNYLVLMNYSSGELGIVKLNSNGSLASGQSYNLDMDWKNAFIYNSTYLILFKGNGGTATYQINSDGRLGSKISEQPYYSSSNEIIVFGQNVLSYSKVDGYLRRAHIANNGSYNTASGSPKYLDTNWATIKYVPFLNTYGQSIGNFMAIDKTTGQIKQYGITENKKIGENWYDSSKINANLEPGFDTITPYDVFDGDRYQNYVMVSNSTTGKIITYHLNNNM